MQEKGFDAPDKELSRAEGSTALQGSLALRGFWDFRPLGVLRSIGMWYVASNSTAEAPPPQALSLDPNIGALIINRYCGGSLL